MRTVYLAGRAAIALSAATAFAGPSPAPSLKSATELDFYPYSFVNVRGQPAGYAVELLRAAGKAEGLEFTFAVGSWSDVRESLETGHIDVLPFMARSAGRSQKVDFTNSHTVVHDAIFVRDGEAGIRSEADLAGKTLIVMKGDTAHDHFKSDPGSYSIREVNTLSEAFRLLQAKAGDAVVCGMIPGIVTLRQLEINGVHALESPLQAYERMFAFAVLKGRVDLVARLNRGLERVNASGEGRDIYRRWFADLDPKLNHRDRQLETTRLGLMAAGAVLAAMSAGVVTLKRRQKQVQVKLTSTENQLRHLIENIPGAVFRRDTDEDWTMFYVSAEIERISGHPAHAFIADRELGYARLIHADDLASAMATVSAAIRGIGTYEMDYRIVHRSGETRFVREKGRMVTDADGSFLWVDGIVFDVTDQVRTQDLVRARELQAFSASRLATLGEMAGGIAHEINNPLAIIGGKAANLRRQLQNGAANAPKIAAELGKIESTVERVAKIVRGLRTISRDADQDPMAPADLALILADTLDLCRQKMGSNGIDLRVLAASLEVECRAAQISQILMNLLSNAYDAVAGLQERWIEIRIEETEASARISVTDSGPGIAVQVADKMMLPFFTTKEVGKGTGLGLSISKALAESHGGSLRYDPTHRHTRFVFEIPLRRSRVVHNRASRHRKTG